CHAPALTCECPQKAPTGMHGCREELSFARVVCTGKKFAFVKQSLDFRIGLVEVIRNCEITLGAPEDAGPRLLVEGDELGDRCSRLRDNYLFSQRHPLQELGKVSFSLVYVDFHCLNYGLS